MSYDFAVIGAGMIGSSCAKYLSGFGHRLEKNFKLSIQTCLRKRKCT